MRDKSKSRIYKFIELDKIKNLATGEWTSLSDIVAGGSGNTANGLVGIFNSSSELNTAYPNPSAGMYAIVVNGGLSDDYYSVVDGDWQAQGLVVTTQPNYLGSIQGDSSSLPDPSTYDEGKFYLTYLSTTKAFAYNVWIKSDGVWKDVNAINTSQAEVELLNVHDVVLHREGAVKRVTDQGDTTDLLTNNSVIVELLESPTGALAINGNEIAFQDQHGDFAYFDRNQGLQLFGQGDTNALIHSKDALELKATSFDFTHSGGGILFEVNVSDFNMHGKHVKNLADGVDDSDAVTVQQLKSHTEIIRNLDDIKAGLQNEIINAASPARAIGALGEALSSNRQDVSGVIDCTAVKMGFLPPVDVSGYGMFVFHFVHGNSNILYMEWTDEDGKNSEGVWVNNHFFGWKSLQSTYTTNEIDEYMLNLGLVSGNLFVNELQVMG